MKKQKMAVKGNGGMVARQILHTIAYALWILGLLAIAVSLFAPYPKLRSGFWYNFLIQIALFFSFVGLVLSIVGEWLPEY